MFQLRSIRFFHFHFNLRESNDCVRSAVVNFDVFSITEHRRVAKYMLLNVTLKCLRRKSIITHNIQFH